MTRRAQHGPVAPSRSPPCPLPPPSAGLGSAAGLFGLFGLGACSRAAPAAAEARPSRQFEVMHSDADWRQRLTQRSTRCCASRPPNGPGAARSTRNTGRAPSPAPAVRCRCSPRPPSSRVAPAGPASGPLHNAIGEDRDVTFGMLRVEVHCRRCGGISAMCSTMGHARPGCATA